MNKISEYVIKDLATEPNKILCERFQNPLTTSIVLKHLSKLNWKTSDPELITEIVSSIPASQMNSTEVKTMLQFLKPLPFDTVENDIYNCARSGNTEFARKLIKNALKAAPDETYLNCPILPVAFYHACRCNQSDFTTFLVHEYGYNPNLYQENQELRPPLHRACKERDTSVLQSLYKNGCKFDAKDQSGSTPLDLADREVITYLWKNRDLFPGIKEIDLLGVACRLGLIEIIESALSNGFGIDQQNDFGDTLLHMACRCNQNNVVRTLLKYNPNLHLLNGIKNEPIHYTIDHNDSLELIILLLDQPSYTKEKIQTIFQDLVGNAQARHALQILKYLLKTYPTHSFELSNGNISRFIYNKQYAILQLLIETEAFWSDWRNIQDLFKMEDGDKLVDIVNKVSDPVKRELLTALLLGTQRKDDCTDRAKRKIQKLLASPKQKEVVRLLNQAHLGHFISSNWIPDLFKLIHPYIDINSPDVEGKSLVEITNNYEIMRALLASRPHLLDKLDISMKYNIVKQAFEKGDTEMVMFLYEYAGDFTMKGNVYNIETLIELALRNKHNSFIKHLYHNLPIFKYLFRASSNLLHEACHTKNKGIARFALENGFDVNKHSSKHDTTPLGIACMHNDLNGVTLLLDHGANMIVEDRLKNTPIDFIKIESDDSRVLELLIKKAKINGLNINTPIKNLLKDALRQKLFKIAALILKELPLEEIVTIADSIELSPEAHKLLIEHGVMPTPKVFKSILSAISNKNELLELINRIQDKQFIPILRMAYYYNQNDTAECQRIVTELLESPEKDQFIQNLNQWGFLHFMCLYEPNKILFDLLKPHFNMNSCNNAAKQTPLHVAIEAKNDAMTRVLVDNQCELDHVDVKGLTPLCSALKQTDLHIARLLVDNNANVNIRFKNQSALSVALFSAYDLDFLCMLFNHGFIPTEQDYKNLESRFRGVQITHLLEGIKNSVVKTLVQIEFALRRGSHEKAEELIDEISSSDDAQKFYSLATQSERTFEYLIEHRLDDVQSHVSGNFDTFDREQQWNLLPLQAPDTIAGFVQDLSEEEKAKILNQPVAIRAEHLEEDFGSVREALMYIEAHLIPKINWNESNDDERTHKAAVETIFSTIGSKALAVAATDSNLVTALLPTFPLMTTLQIRMVTPQLSVDAYTGRMMTLQGSYLLQTLCSGRVDQVRSYVTDSNLIMNFLSKTYTSLKKLESTIAAIFTKEAFERAESMHGRLNPNLFVIREQQKLAYFRKILSDQRFDGFRFLIDINLEHCAQKLKTLAPLHKQLAEALAVKGKEFEEYVPEEFRDTVMKTLMEDPVKLPSGHFVDRSTASILTKDPISRDPIPDNLETDLELQGKIQTWERKKAVHQELLKRS